MSDRDYIALAGASILLGAIVGTLLGHGWRPLGAPTTYWLMVANHILLLGMGFGLGYGVCWFRSRRILEETVSGLIKVLSPDERAEASDS